MHVCKQMPVHIFELMYVCAGTVATAALEGTDGRGKWTPVPEDYCGAQDQSAAYVPLWASVTHYSTWSQSSTSPSWTSPPRHLSPRTDNPPSLPSSLSALRPRQPAPPPPASRNQESSYMGVTCCFPEL